MQTGPVLHVRHVSGLSGQSDGGALQASSYYSSPLISWRRLCSDREAAAQNSSDERRRQTSIILPAACCSCFFFFSRLFWLHDTYLSVRGNEKKNQQQWSKCSVFFIAALTLPVFFSTPIFTFFHHLLGPLRLIRLNSQEISCCCYCSDSDINEKVFIASVVTVVFSSEWHQWTFCCELSPQKKVTLSSQWNEKSPSSTSLYLRHCWGRVARNTQFWESTLCDVPTNFDGAQIGLPR